MARDKFHYEFRQALEREGWTVTDDPLTFKVVTIMVQIDLGAEKLIAAELAGQKIAVEIKTFSQKSFINALYEAVWKYIVYRKALQLKEPERTLYLAIPDDIFQEYRDEPIIKGVFEDEKINFILYEPESQSIMSWIGK